LCERAVGADSGEFYQDVIELPNKVTSELSRKLATKFENIGDIFSHGRFYAF